MSCGAMGVKTMFRNKQAGDKGSALIPGFGPVQNLRGRIYPRSGGRSEQRAGCRLHIRLPHQALADQKRPYTDF